MPSDPGEKLKVKTNNNHQNIERYCNVKLLIVIECYNISAELQQFMVMFLISFQENLGIKSEFVS